jgi:hypothetical protein
MQNAFPEETIASPGQTPSGRLDSWKEIAAYFRRDVRTVRRWEQTLGLPVHRHRQQRGVAVYAYKHEVDEWWRQRDATAAEAPAPRRAILRIGPVGWVVLAVLASVGLWYSGLWHAGLWHSGLWPSDSWRAGSWPAGSSRAASNLAPGSPAAAVTPAGNLVVEEYPSLSPDAQQLAFSWDGDRHNFDIYKKALDSSQATPVRLTLHPAADVNPTWSPDGRSIAFVRKMASGEFGILVIPAMGGKERNVAMCLAEWDRRAGSYLAWTPDGRGLMVLQRESDGQTAGLLLLPPKGPARRLVLPLDGSRVSQNGLVIGPTPCLAAG